MVSLPHAGPLSAYACLQNDGEPPDRQAALDRSQHRSGDMFGAAARGLSWYRRGAAYPYMVSIRSISVPRIPALQAEDGLADRSTVLRALHGGAPVHHGHAGSY